MASAKTNVVEGAYIRHYTQYQGASIEMAGAFTDAAGAPIDISDDTLVLTIVDRQNRTKLQLEIGDGITFPAAHKYLAVITAAQCRALPEGQQLTYVLQWTRASDGMTKPIRAGYILLTLNPVPAA